MAGALAAGKMWEILAATLDPPAFGPVNALAFRCRLDRAQESLAGLGVNIQVFLMELNSFKSLGFSLSPPAALPAGRYLIQGTKRVGIGILSSEDHPGMSGNFDT